MLKPIVADFRPHELTASDVTQIVRAVGRKHGATTANQCRATLSAVFGFAIELGLATINPVRDTKKIAIPKRKRYVENAELDAIGAAGSPVIQAVIDLAYVTGQRISDVLDLGLDVKNKEYVTLVQRKTGHRMKLRRTRGLITVIKAVMATCEKQLRKSAREKGVEPETIVFNSRGWSAIDAGHVPFVVALACGRRQVVQPLDLLGAQVQAVGGGVLLDAGDPFGAGNRGDVIALRCRISSPVPPRRGDP